MARPKVAHPMKRVMVTLPPDLLATISQVTQRQDSNRSELIRKALEFYLAEVKRQEFAEEMKEGYLVNAERSLRICNEFAYADAELAV